MPNSSASRPTPSKHRLALLMLLVIYPFVTGILYVLTPLTEGWPIWARTALLAPIMVVSIIYGIAPMIQRHFAWFILRKPRLAA
jgi:antibiotic biosynthesis monooxygenase (ABM) superfamily enzyme